MLFAALHESGSGTFRRFYGDAMMSDIEVNGPSTEGH
jgi:hypothetical protein